MSRSNLFLAFPVLFITLTFSPTPTASQTKTTNQPADEKSRKVKAEPDNAFREWLKEDVAIIITPEERAAFEKLKTDEERAQFTQIFWDRRDPSPDTEENEYRDQHYERVAYANEHFTSGKAGWLTDRGRIYIKFGKPDEIESYHSGGQYDRRPYEGGGSTTTYPFQRWFYRYVPGVGSGVEIEFVDPTGTGEYRIARDPDEKTVAGLAPGPGRLDPSFTNFADGPFSITQLNDLEKPPLVERNLPGGTSTNSPIVDDNPLNFDLQTDFFRMSDGRVYTVFTVQAANRDLTFEDSGGLQNARLNLTGRIVTVTNRRVGSFEDSVTSSATVAELADLKNRKSVYSKAVILAPGIYKINVMVRDVVSGATGSREFGFKAPKYDDHKLATSSIVLAAKLESMEGRVAGGPFVIGRMKVVPNLSGIFHRGQPVGVYMQLYNAGIDQTTLRPSVDIEYVLLSNGKELSRQTEDWRGLSDTGERLTLARVIDTAGLAPGDYDLEIRIRDQVSSQVLRPETKFTIVR